MAILLTLVCFSAACAKDYDFKLQQSAKLGARELASGDYTVALQGSVAMITEVTSKKSFTAIVKVENLETKGEHTRVATATREDGTHLLAIMPGGTTIKLSFE